MEVKINLMILNDLVQTLVMEYQEEIVTMVVVDFWVSKAQIQI